MKKLALVILSVMILLCGCLAAPVYETLGGVPVDRVVPAVKEINISLPDHASVQTIQGGSGKIYICDGYDVMVETLSGGDLNKTLQTLTGFTKESLTVVQTKQDGLDRYTCVWTSIGESGSQVGRSVIVDDGAYHYCLSVIAPSETVLSVQQEIQSIFDSFVLGAT